MKVETRNETTFNISGKCNLNCIFCSGYPKKIDIDKVKNSIVGLEEISLQGGEPTISPYFFDIIDFAKKNKVKKINLITNGIAFSNQDFVKKVVSFGINEYHIALPSHKQELSDFLGQSNNVLKNKVAGIKNLAKFGDSKKIRIVHLIQEKNYKDLANFVLFINKIFGSIGKIEFKFIQYFNNKNNIENIPYYKEVELFLNKALLLCKKLGIDFIVNGIPLCFIEEDFHINSSSYYNDNSNEQMKIYATKKLKKCKNCNFSKNCIGIRNDYLLLKGTDEFVI